jgi:hypothetical protein
MDEKHDIKNILSFEPWQSMLPEISQSRAAAAHQNSPDQKPASMQNPALKTLSELSAEAKILGLDCASRIEFHFSERMKWINLSGRNIQKAKNELLQKNLIREIFLGKNLFLAPTAELFDLFGIQSPYRRNTWQLHSFLVLLAARLIEKDPLVEYARTEVSIGDSNSTVDIISALKNGQRLAWEVTHRCTTNVLANCAKLQNKGFSQIIFLCADYETKQKVWPQIRNAGFDPDFTALIRCTIFSSLLKKRKQIEHKGTS